MKKSKLIFITIFSVFLLLFGVNAVKAEETMTDEDCKACAERNGGRCGYCRACALVNGECVVNKHDKELFDAGECAEKATTATDCDKCDGYVWSSSSNKCVAEASKEGESINNQNKNEQQNEETEKRRPKAKCGNITGIPKIIPKLTSLAVTIIQIAVPVLLIIMGSLDLFKGITAGKEDEMKKGQQMFIKRLIVGALIFFVVAITKLLISVVANSSDTSNISSCISCFVSNDCK